MLKVMNGIILGHNCCNCTCRMVRDINSISLGCIYAVKVIGKDFPLFDLYVVVGRRRYRRWLQQRDVTRIYRCRNEIICCPMQRCGYHYFYSFNTWEKSASIDFEGENDCTYIMINILKTLFLCRNTFSL